MSEETPKADAPEAVIDAEFEPVEDGKAEIPDDPKPPRKRPAWPLVWFLFFIALTGGGVLGAVLALAAPRFVPQLATQPAGEAAQIAALQGQVKSLSDNLANLPAPDVDALQQRIADLEAKVSTSAGAPPEDMAKLQDSVRQLSDRVNALEARPVPTGDGKTGQVDLAPILKRLSALESEQPDLSLYARKTDIPAPVNLAPLQDEIAKLQAKENSNTDGAADLSGIETRLNALEAQGQNDSQAHVQAVWSQLQLAAQGTDPFPDSLQSALQIWPGNAQLKSLESAAQSGAPTMAQLGVDFDALIPELVRAEHTVPANAGWMQKIGAAFGSLVTVRNTSGKGDSVDARITRAQTAMQGHDLNAAISEIAALPAKFHDLTQNWLAQARARAVIQAVVDNGPPPVPMAAATPSTTTEEPTQ